MLAQNGHQAFAAARATQAPQRLQHREISLPSPVVFDTLPAPDPYPPFRGCLSQEGVHQGGLADPRLPGHEHHLALPAEGFL